MNSDPEEIEKILRRYRISPSLINWKNNPIPATRIWYCKEDNRMHADCGVSMPFDYDPHTQLYNCVVDMAKAVIDHYRAQGIELEM